MYFRLVAFSRFIPVFYQAKYSTVRTLFELDDILVLKNRQLHTNGPLDMLWQCLRHIRPYVCNDGLGGPFAAGRLSVLSL